MREGNRSLNLSNAVTLVTYEAWRQNGFEIRPAAAISPPGA
jgi:tRNA(Leu) C34 or U34 (ribose-2'-O)-methylase TrmL